MLNILSSRAVASVLAGLLLVAANTAFAQTSGDYVIGAQDILAISVLEQADLGGKYVVESDGTFTFPLVGRIKAAGLTLRQFEQTLKARLADGYFRNPQVSVGVDQYRSQRIFVSGEVKNESMYQLTSSEMTLVEAIVRAGGTLEGAGGEVLVVHRRPGAAAISGQVGATDAEQQAKDNGTTVIRVDLKALQAGDPAANVRLQDNDMIYVPRAELVYVSGQVKSPGSFSLQRGMTVLQALALAGGITDRGSDSRVFARRVENGKTIQVKVKTDDLVHAGDTIIVQERFF